MRAYEIISEKQLHEIDLKKLRTAAAAGLIGGSLALMPANTIAEPNFISAPSDAGEFSFISVPSDAGEFISTPKDQNDIPVKQQPVRASKELIAAMIQAESRGDPNAENDKSGAQGLMQLMPATAKAMGVTDPFDPEQNRVGGTKYINSMLARYNGDYELALMAFNWGPGNVSKWLSKGRPNIVPRETRNYVKKLLPIALGELKVAATN